MTVRGMSARALRATRTAALACVVASSLVACADLLGTDFSGDPRGPDAGADATLDGAAIGDGAVQDGATQPGSDGASGGDSTTTDGTTSDGPGVDTSDPYFTSCSFQATTCVCQGWPFPIEAGPPCDTARFVDGGICCADPGYPQSGNCSCGGWQCKPGTGGSCLCGAYSEGGLGASCVDTYCCAHPTLLTCSCGPTQALGCPSFYFDANNVPIGQCSQQTELCPNGGHQVTSCSAP